MQRLLMENKREIRGPKFKSYDGVLSPINSINVGNRRYRAVLDPYASDSSDSASPLMKFLRSVDPATSGSSSPVFVTPVKVEEDVIVMDGISVPKSNKGSGEVRMRLPFSANSVNCSFGKSNLSSSSSSSGSGGRRIGAENIKSFKNRLCHFWETSGICQFGFECQFAHGKEELRHNRYAGKIKHEPLNRISKLNSNFEGSIPSPYGSKFSRNSQFKTVAAAAAARTEEAFSPPSLPTGMVIPASPIPAKTIISPGGTIPDSTLPIWTPQMDGIEVSLPSDFTLENSSSKDDANAYIDKVLHGKNTNARKRLPVFVDICPDC